MGLSRFSLLFLEEKDSIKDIQTINGIVASPTQSQSLRVAALKQEELLFSSLRSHLGAENPSYRMLVPP